MVKFVRKRFIYCLMAICMLFITLTPTTVSANSSKSSVFTNTITTTYSGGTVNTLCDLNKVNDSGIYTQNFTTNNTYTLKLMLVAEYVDESTGSFTVYFDGINKGKVSIDGSGQILTLGTFSSGNHQIALWPDDFYKPYIVVGKVYYLS